MKVQRRSPLTGKINEMDLDITQEQIDVYNSGASYIQDIFPNLSPAEREFIKTGYTEADWAAMFPPEDQ